MSYVSRKTAIVFTGIAALCVVLGVLAMLYLPVPKSPASVGVFADRLMSEQGLPVTDLKIQTGIGSSSFTVEVAATPESRRKGLMHRESLEPDHGMLFDFGVPPHVVHFWMKNTPLPLDMIFVNPAGQVVHVHENAVPFSENRISSQQPVRVVLEFEAGTVQRHGIRVGDQVRHALFNTFQAQ